MSGLTSVAGILALLNDEYELQVHSLKQLNELVPIFWAEMADSLPLIEHLCDKDFKEKKLASLLTSKIYYHLGALSESMHYALIADELFDINDDSEYVTTITAKFIDEYAIASSKTDQDIDSNLSAIVERMFHRCLNDKEFKQAVGMAIECKRLDIITKAIKQSPIVSDMLEYCYQVCTNLVSSREFKKKVLETLVSIYQEEQVADYASMTRCLVFLDKPVEIARLFDQLLKDTANKDKTLLVYQIAFELVDNSTQKFLGQVKYSLSNVESNDEVYNRNLITLQNILSGEPTITLMLQFMFKNNRADINVLSKIKSLFEPRQSVLHTATIITNCIMHTGTTRDNFLRENLEWLSKAVNWAKFTTTAGLGVIHKGHLTEAFNVLDPYLPKPGVEASPYTEGGSLYAYGLIHANHGHGRVTEYLLQQLRNIDSQPEANANASAGLDASQKREIVQHGAALGLGIASLGSSNEEVFKELLELLYHHDSAVAGEAAGLSIGLVMLGNPSNVKEVLNFAHATQHEKIIRSLGLALALMVFGLEEQSDSLVETLSSDKDPLLRYGAQFAIGLAYCGTGNNNAIQKLLHFAVSDVSDDVRRAAVCALGFVMFRQPEVVPRLVSLLSESYNPHVRYGAAIALGIACACSGNKEAISLLEPMTSDPVPFVRQGAFISLAMIIVQISEKVEPKVKEIRKLLMDVVADKHQSIIAKFGAIIGLGIVDAGGRNVNITLASRSGHTNLVSVVGLFVFIQYWYWYPFMLFVSLALSPTTIIALNENLQLPLFSMKSNAPPSTYAYPPDLKEPKEKETKQIPKAQLSITKKIQQRQEKKRDKSTHDMVIEEPGKEENTEKNGPEPDYEILSNPARVTRRQTSCLTFDIDQRYRPITNFSSGIILLRDTKPGVEEKLVESSIPGTNSSIQDQEVEVSPPPPFEFLG
eukprot:TRINITY_DN2459_c0_g1_i1.p1 TRINITY_DN2459_c0_g1~~TRINITY_DN2459_c0_g1_i1.p1  ORF type:complete len:930 (-),score=94.57 TRINITY_DN2459_c0_g1_i1:58-2847(-)